MNREQILGLIRQVLPFVGGYLVTKGYISEEGFAAISDDLVGAAGLVIALASGVWSMMDKTDKAIVAKAEALPEVAKVEMCCTPPGVEIAKALNKPSSVTVQKPAPHTAPLYKRGA